MLPGINRLKKKRDFERVFKQGRGLREGFMSLKLTKNGQNSTRFGFVVGQRVSHKAVVRNKVKRMLRDFAKLKLKDIKKGFDVVVIAGKGLEKEKPEDAAATFYRLIKLSRLLND